ncbi:MAG TPA: basic amino acid/polyamine antiporter [Casimicrobiaceae bacterium]
MDVTSSSAQKLSLGALVALVVGSMVGSGIFALPAAFGRATGAFGALIAWAIAGVGMLMLAFVFQTLSRRRPDLDAGIYAYAKAGFGDYLGFASAFGYWIACCLADVACLLLIKSTLGMFVPAFGDGTTIPAIVGASVILWAFHFLVLRGVRQAAALNTIATVAKTVPLGIFVVLAIAGFRADLFALNFWGVEAPTFANVAGQVRNTMLVTVFVFVGIEGASVYSRYAKNRADVGIATVLGFLGVLALLVIVTMLCYGILLRPDLAVLQTPSLAGVMEALVGRWGTVFISVGLLISVLGNYLSWSLLAAEVLHSAASNDTMPVFLARENRHGVPEAALWSTNIVIQTFLVVTYFAEYAFTLALKMTSAMTLIPYLLVAAYGFKLAWTRETYDTEPRERDKDVVIGALAAAYALAMIIAGGLKFVLLAALLYAPGTVLFRMARRQQGAPVFASTLEWTVFGITAFAAVVALFGLLTGALTV